MAAGRRRGVSLLTIAGLVLAQGALAASAAAEPSPARFLEQLRSTMRALRAESAADAERIREAYELAPETPPLADRAALAAALATGQFARLPAHAPLFNLKPRLHGAHPIGERDLPHQPLYVAADPAALGCLLHVAARVRSAPLDVTSLARHLDYQRRLQRTNPNARTPLPMHTTGLAFDISVLNVPLQATRELRDVLRGMRDAGDLFFVAETQQLVFHVVPAPARLAFYRELFAALISAPVPDPALHVERNLLAEAGLPAGWVQADAAASRSVAATIAQGGWAVLLAISGLVAR